MSTIKAFKKASTNDKMFKTLLAELDGSVLTAILRERLLTIMNITVNDIKKDSSQYDNPIISHKAYLQLAELVNKHMGMED